MPDRGRGRVAQGGVGGGEEEETLHRVLEIRLDVRPERGPEGEQRGEGERDAVAIGQ